MLKLQVILQKMKKNFSQVKDNLIDKKESTTYLCPLRKSDKGEKYLQD